MSSFKDLKNNRMSNLQNLTKQVEKLTEKPSYTDDRIWKPEKDKTGNGYCVIRFLPAPTNEDVPWVRIWTHGFKGPGGWYIENSLTTPRSDAPSGSDDPVSKANTMLWNSGIESDKEIARKQKRKLQYFSNIYVVSDSKHPENEGKVFLFRYGKKIFDKLMASMQPEFEDETPINPFDFWQGANFKLKIRKVDGYWNYDKSEFEAPSAMFDNDGQIEDVWKKAYALNEFSAPTNFKSYEELKTRLDTVLSGTTTVGNVMESVTKDPEPEMAPRVDTKPTEAVAPASEEDTTEGK